MKHSDPIHVGTDRQLFLNDRLIANMNGVSLRLHTPERREIALQFNTGYYPWEGETSWCPTVVNDNGVYRMYYRASSHANGGIHTAVAESVDGVHWYRPRLGVIEHDGSTANNLVIRGTDERSGMSMVFLDGNPDAPADERYKAIGRCPEGVTGLVSADGYHWRLCQDEPILPKDRLQRETNDTTQDSPNVGLWDPWRKEYVLFMRGWPEISSLQREGRQSEIVGVLPGKERFRWIRRATSPDFRTWTTPEYVDTGDVPYEQFYTNSAWAYERAPGTYLMFPKRFVETRTREPDWVGGPGQSDIVFMSSRDGVHWDRTFMEGYIRPGPEIENWHERSILVSTGMIQTQPWELSMYIVEHYRTPTARCVRMAIRTDGFVSLNAGYRPGTVVTQPMAFAGSRLSLNYATSAVGSVRVAVCDADGKPLPGFSLDDCAEMWGDHIDGRVTWDGGSGDCGELARHAGKPVRLRFELKDSDLYAFKFSG